ncbi:MAG TPA: hypothetical protein VM733_22515 [Thermoanaerobaculia bacterium]|nr:hypothetical protein [Thermoanaerobaculia bacterium]
MKTPEQIRVRIECPDEDDLSGIIVEMLVHAGGKNAYRIYFPKTNTLGVTTLTREDFNGQFKDHWEGGVMDHEGTLDTADPVVSFGLYNATWSIENRDAALAWPLLTHERTRWFSREEQYFYRTSTRNKDFVVVTPIKVDLERTSDVVLPLRRKIDAIGLG